MRLAPFLLLAACSSPSAAPDASSPDATGGQTDGLDEHCASTFGDALTDDFGRVDGTVIAIVEPGNTRCPMPNDDHVIIQVDLDGAIHRMVVNVESSFGDPEIYILALGGIPLPAPAFAEGWHPGLSLDYGADLDIQEDDAFGPYDIPGAVAKITDNVGIGDHVSVYATSSGGTYAHSAHLIHRNGGNTDGAIVVDPDTASPTWLLFRFADQSW